MVENVAYGAEKSHFKFSIHDSTNDYSLFTHRLHIMSGKLEGSEEVLKSNLRSAIPLLKASGVVGLIEPINKYSVPGYFLNDFAIGTFLKAYFVQLKQGSPDHR